MIHLTRSKPSTNLNRFYAMHLAPTLFSNGHQSPNGAELVRLVLSGSSFSKPRDWPKPRPQSA